MDISKIVSAFWKSSKMPKKHLKEPSNENKEYFHTHANVCSEMIIKAKEKQ